MGVRLLVIALLIALAGCGRPATGDSVAVEGVVVSPPKEWPTPMLGLKSPELPGDLVFLQGDLRGAAPGDRVHVEGVFHEYSIHMRSVIEVRRIEPA